MFLLLCCFPESGRYTDCTVFLLVFVDEPAKGFLQNLTNLPAFIDTKHPQFSHHFRREGNCSFLIRFMLLWTANGSWLFFSLL